jgi:hypothetical protein
MFAEQGGDPPEEQREGEEDRRELEHIALVVGIGTFIELHLRLLLEGTRLVEVAHCVGVASEIVERSDRFVIAFPPVDRSGDA